MASSFKSSMPNTPSLKKSSSSQSSKNQKSIVGFFQRSGNTSSPSTQLASGDKDFSVRSVKSEKPNPYKKPVRAISQSLTPAPSSDTLEEDSPEENSETKKYPNKKDNGLPSPTSPTDDLTSEKLPANTAKMTLNFNSPSRKVSVIYHSMVLD